eukprot:c3895_g1_i1.p1 GENE.c3895_g1_i1~~c3895_g1_i1.p1  ORF type:complete len:192 (+),score=26.92 c3895_g1_i1:31-576(+)
MSDLPEPLDLCVSQLESNLSELESTLNELLESNFEEVRNDQAVVARLNVALAFALNSCFFMLLKTQGVSPKEHPVKKELDRIKTYISKLNDLDTPKPTPTTKVNVEAAGRVLAHSLGSNQKGSRSSSPPKPVPVTKSIGKPKSRSTELSSSRRSTPQPRAAHLQFREYQKLRAESKTNEKD